MTKGPEAAVGSLQALFYFKLEFSWNSTATDCR